MHAHPDSHADLDAARAAIAGHVARTLGFDGLAGLNPSARADVERRTAEAIDGYDPTGPGDGAEADGALRRRLAAHHGLLQLRADAADVRLAEAGEVFAPEDDA